MRTYTYIDDIRDNIVKTDEIIDFLAGESIIINLDVSLEMIDFISHYNSPRDFMKFRILNVNKHFISNDILDCLYVRYYKGRIDNYLEQKNKKGGID